ncbi:MULTISPECIES: hypothetical protein [unclassified Pseudoalteromonas]|uniref:hypothetical protein n=1 Tax=unclassified Pseudoalteromonas TaxID=194690 RepID=UPI002097D9A8|nr:hypothetical protein [Pseudoalteromonas sp. XMcav2-N]MCO7189493.1 hypothetical protein [Pseudoalteromonas sp. XMcav2-N]
MKLTLNKKKLKGLTADSNALPGEMTPEVAGGTYTNHPILCYPTIDPACNTDIQQGCPTNGDCYTAYGDQYCRIPA